MKLEGRILLFDKVNKNGVAFSKTCKVHMPEKLPLLWNYKEPIGSAKATIDDNGIFASAETFEDPCYDQYVNEIMKNGMMPVGGEYYVADTHTDDKNTIIDKAALVAVSLISNPACDGCSFEIIKEKEE